MKFSSLGLSDSLLNAIHDKGYETPSPIQAQAIPVVLSKQDLMAAAQTGTGKTAAFTLPILELLSHGEPAKKYEVRTLILTPTRELAAQIEANIKAYSKYMDIRYGVVFGGVNIKPQISKLKKGVDILVATPGRLMDLWGQKALKFSNIEILVLDEADRMLDMGFINDIKRVLSILPKKRQNLLFSATFSKDIRALARTMINDPVEISVTPRNTTVDAIEHGLLSVDKSQKTAALIHLIKKDKKNDWSQVLVFGRTKHGSNKLVQKLIDAGISAKAIHGNKSQNARTEALADFKKNKIQILVATDIAARGIDIQQLPLVVNFDLPNTPEDYVHRIGRTGRAGLKGHALSLVCADEIKELLQIEKLINQKLPRDELRGFEPVHALPFSTEKQKNSRSKKHPPKPGSLKEMLLLKEKAREAKEQDNERRKQEADQQKKGRFGSHPHQTAKNSGKAQSKNKRTPKERKPGMFSADQKVTEKKSTDPKQPSQFRRRKKGE
ncbi:MAG: DEAD/DEAH box helicase [Fibrobacterales bacterium]